VKICRKKTAKIEVKVSQCVHYCCFRYGHNEYNPYETYIRRLHNDEGETVIRAEFIYFLLHYRPRCFGEALGINLSKQYPLWIYPWEKKQEYLAINPTAGWLENPKKIPDIITHFSELGIPMFMIQKEYDWLHGAYKAILENGYKPDLFGYPKGRLLIKENGDYSCLMLDGNHRLSVLSALGYSSLIVEYYPKDSIRISEVDCWQGVKNRFYSQSDAISLFLAYFNGNNNYHTTEISPSILG
jgi:hypothetical protein